MGLDAGDLRTWLERVNGIGELRTVRGAQCEDDIGNITEWNNRRPEHPALVFADIPGYPAGHRVVSGSLGSATRIAAAFGLLDGQNAAVWTGAHLVETFRQKLRTWTDRARANLAEDAPRVVATGPVNENLLRGADIDITAFPAPRWHDGDGGRYLATGCCVITRDPETGWVNLGAYRGMVKGPRSISVNVGNNTHGRLHIQKWWERGEPCPVAICAGQGPLLFALSGIEVPTGVSEYQLAGAILGSPVTVIASEHTGLPVPAQAEIVLEGFLHPDRTTQDGPFGEWQGYFAKAAREKPLLEVELLRHRHNPIILGAPPAKPPHDYSFYRTVVKSAMIEDALGLAGVPDIRRVWAHECGGGRCLLVVSLKQRYYGHSRQAALLAAQVQASTIGVKYVITVDDDIDATDLEQVMWALCTRSVPSEDIDIIRETYGSGTDPLLFEGAPPSSSFAILDACKPYRHYDRFPKTAEVDPAVLAEVGRRWGPMLE